MSRHGGITESHRGLECVDLLSDRRFTRRFPLERPSLLLMATQPQNNSDRETYLTVRDVVSRIRKAHQLMRDALERPRSVTTDERTRLILESLRKSEQGLQLTLARFENDGEEELLETWLQYVPNAELFESLDRIEFTPDLPADEVVSRKLSFDQSLLSLLRQLADETSVPRVQEFFHTILKNVESRVARQAWSVSEYQADAEPPIPGV